MTKTVKTLTLVAVIAAVAPACATKGFVREEVTPVAERVDTLATEAEATDQRTRNNAEEIGEVNRRAGAAMEAAMTAQTSADAATGAADRVNSRVDSIETAARRLIFEVTINEEQGNFAFGSANLPDEAQARLDELVSQLTQSPDSVWVEIEGHTDSTGPEMLNRTLGMERAEAVKAYLYEQHHLPLHTMTVISYGEDRPVAPNETGEGRAQNRRVVIRVLS
jgi:outer membrane protein OmpA-like peptidoglycan-associated protein